MKTLTQLISEMKVDTKDAVLCEVYEAPKTGFDEAGFKKWLINILPTLKDKAILIGLEEVKAYNSRVDDRYNQKLRSTAERVASEYKAYTKLTNEEDREKWLSAKIEELREYSLKAKSNGATWLVSNPPTRKRPNIQKEKYITDEAVDTKKWRFTLPNFWNSGTNSHAYWDDNYNELADDIIGLLPDTYDGWDKHLVRIHIVTWSRFAESGEFYIYCEFDDEYEEKYDKKAKSLGDAISAEYGQGHYMGD